MFEYIMFSLTKECKSKIISDNAKHQINGINNDPLVFMQLMSMAIIDTRATTAYLQTQLTDLDSYMSTVYMSNIELFNEYAR